MIEHLADDQEAELESYFHRLSRPLRRAGEEGDPEKLEAAVIELYHELDLPPPVIILCDSPWQMSVSEAIASLCMVPPLETESLLSELRKRLDSPLWLACLDRLEEHPELLRSLRDNQRADSSSASMTSIKQLRSSLFGKSTDTPMRFVLTRLMGDEGTVASMSQLSVRVKLKLREILKTRLNGAIPELTGFRLLRQLTIEIPDSLDDFFSEEPVKAILAGFEETGRPIPGRTPAGQYFSTFQPAALAADRVADFPLFAFVNKNLGLNDDPALLRKIDAWQTLFDSAFNWCGYERAIFLSRYPVECSLDERSRLHSEDGPALSFHDGRSIYFIHGVAVPEAVVTDPASLTVDAIEAEENVEVRRIMIERFGLERYIDESGAVAIDSDACGVLYRKEQKLDEPLVVVKVVDSTSVEQGQPRHYFLRVPPYMRTARQAVAWTFNLSSGDYSPAEQT